MKEFNLTEAQSQAIVDMRLRALTGLERSKIEAELAELQKKIDEYVPIIIPKIIANTKSLVVTPPKK